MRKLFSTKKRIAIVAIAGVAVLATGGTAFAYFTSGGSGTGSATVGSAGTNDWVVTQTSSTGTLFPIPSNASASTIAANSATITFQVKNNGSGSEEYSAATPTIDSVTGTPAGDAESGNPPADISGCTSGWFSATVATDPSLNTSIAPGGTATVTVTVTMTDSGTSQNNCENKTPDVNLAIS